MFSNGFKSEKAMLSLCYSSAQKQGSTSEFQDNFFLLFFVVILEF